MKYILIAVIIVFALFAGRAMAGSVNGLSYVDRWPTATTYPTVRKIYDSNANVVCYLYDSGSTNYQIGGISCLKL